MGAVKIHEYLDSDEQSKTTGVARKLNPDIKIYRTGIDANAFKLNEELIKTARWPRNKTNR